jgi:hypothetical protein
MEINDKNIKEAFENVIVDITVSSKHLEQKELVDVIKGLENKFSETAYIIGQKEITFTSIDYAFCRYICLDIRKIMKSAGIEHCRYSFKAYIKNKDLSKLNVPMFMQDYEEDMVMDICYNIQSVKDVLRNPSSYSDLVNGYDINFQIMTEGMYLDFSKMTYFSIDLPLKKGVTTDKFFSVLNYIIYTVYNSISDKKVEDKVTEKIRDKYMTIFESPDTFRRYMNDKKHIELLIDLRPVEKDDEKYKQFFNYYKDLLVELLYILKKADDDNEISLNFDTDNNMLEMKIDSLEGIRIQNKTRRFFSIITEKVKNCTLSNLVIHDADVVKCRLFNCELIDCEEKNTTQE